MEAQPSAFRKIVTDLFLFTIVCAVLAGTIIGFKLNGWSYIGRFDLYLYVLGFLFLARLLRSLAKHIPGVKDLYTYLFSQRTYLPVVREKRSMLTNMFYLLFLIVVLVIPFVSSQYILSICITALVYILLSLGLNIVVGFAGLLDLGFVAFYAVGAYTVALTFKYFDLSFWLAMPLGAIVAAFFGMVLGFPVLRMHGDYLAIVTLGFGEIIRLVVNNWLGFTNGPNGIRLDKPYISFFGFSLDNQGTSGTFQSLFGFPAPDGFRLIFIYSLMVVVVGIAIFFCSRLSKLPLGRAWEAIREDQIAASSLGLNHVTIKLAAFSMGAFFGGLGGTFFAAFTEFVSPSSFTFIESALILAIVVLGGLGSIPGVVVAAVVMTLLPEFLRDIAQFRILIFGCIMIVMMIWRPRGLTKVIRPLFSKPN